MRCVVYSARMESICDDLLCGKRALRNQNFLQISRLFDHQSSYETPCVQAVDFLLKNRPNLTNIESLPMPKYGPATKNLIDIIILARKMTLSEVTIVLVCFTVILTVSGMDLRASVFQIGSKNFYLKLNII